jgi:hypothetical protein
MDDQPCRDYFLRPRSPSHRRYEALRAVFIDGRPVAEVAAHFGYKPTAFKVLISRFRHDVRSQDGPPFSSPMVADVRRDRLAARTAMDPTRRPSPIGGPST